MANSRTNRNFTTTEEADLSCSSFVNIKTEVFENMAWYTQEGRIGAQLFAIGDNEYMVHQETSCEVYITDSLEDAMNHAADLVESS